MRKEDYLKYKDPSGKIENVGKAELLKLLCFCMSDVAFAIFTPSMRCSYYRLLILLRLFMPSSIMNSHLYLWPISMMQINDTALNIIKMLK